MNWTETLVVYKYMCMCSTIKPNKDININACYTCLKLVSTCITVLSNFYFFWFDLLYTFIPPVINNVIMRSVHFSWFWLSFYLSKNSYP